MLNSNRGRLAILAALHFIVDFYAALRTPLAEPTLTRHLDCSLGDVMVIFTIAGIVTNFIQPLSGALLPGRGVPKILLVAPVFSALACLIGLTGSYIGITALLVVSGIAVGVLHPEGLLAANEVSGRRQGLGVAIYVSGGFFGHSVGQLVAAEWATHYNLAGFWALAFLSVPAVALVLISGIHKVQAHQKKEVVESKPKHSVPYWAVFILAVMIAFNVRLFCMYITPFLVREFSDSAQAWGGWAIFFFGLFGSLASYLWGHISESKGRCLMIAVIHVIGWPLLLFAFSISSPWLASIWGAVLGLTLGSVFPLAIVLAGGSPGASSRLRGGMIIGGAWGLSQVFIMMLGKWWIDLFPSGDPMPVKSVLELMLYLTVAVAAMALVLRKWEMKPAAV